ncbi:pyruvate carboxylase [Anaerosphaera multitolerans]|uniref:Pyruvate carboxylase n=1 Tax=Anaerosphaera multitolerans TaxID=2487351 RepID=A0A437S5I6_9FIRM|nr:pyruvate carboxylase [Anaerosphaera multitolerans]
MKKFKKVLVANRGEIAIRIFRACRELGIRSVAIYSVEDSLSLFRTKADESYLIGKGKSPLDAYLDIDEIINLAINKNVDAIHPGYGFLAENAEFAKKCEEAGIVFIGPQPEVMASLGDKIESKKAAKNAGVKVIPGTDKAIKSEKEALRYAKEAGYPVMLKAAAGGGGRGMRIVKSEDELIPNFRSAKMEASKAFGNDSMFIEKYLENPKHIEVQILGDKYGNVVHLFERDCSIQRRHQKVIEYTPAFSIDEKTRKNILDDALKIAKSLNYLSAGTVEFLVDKNNNHYFIEVNSRIQVEHTITEMVTGIDLIQSMIYIAEGYPLNSPEINIPNQDSIKLNGYSIQCRITTEDPLHDFAPDTGQITHYRSSSGFGVRLDGGNAYTGAIITPYYDSLLVKVISHARTWEDTISKAFRAIRETKVTGVKTNSSFLLNVLNSKEFRNGTCDTGFISKNPSLFQFKTKPDAELRLMSYIGEIVVNNPSKKEKLFNTPILPSIDNIKDYRGSKQIFDELGAKGLSEWILNQKRLLITDTTMRDAHQSLMATRVRTIDLIKIAQATNNNMKELFSVEMWGGATFDVAYRFLQEDPWERLKMLRELMPNILMQMLIRGNNTVGYTNYPDNVVKKFIKKSAEDGIDIFRIFDSLNWMENMRLSIDQVLENGKIAEGTMCYTGDILDEKRDKYNLKYYVDLAKEIEKSGCHILGIKDMSGLLKPYAARKLIKTLKNEISIPIHLHTHDTTGNGVATVLMATEVGVDIADLAINSMSGLTSQPALNSVVAALQNTQRDTELNLDKIEDISKYWDSVREVYANFESDLKSGSTEIYKYEIPGGQYSNLKPQVESFGLGYKFKEVKEMFSSVNEMVGDIIKVTPSSKMVGDFAIFMVQNGLTPDNILEKGSNLDYPDSVKSYFKGMMGQPLGGFPKDLQKMILKGEDPITVRAGLLLEDEDYEADKNYLESKYNINPSQEDLISYSLYPKVFEDYIVNTQKNGSLWMMPSHVFFHGLMENETAEIPIDTGKNLIVTLVEIGKRDKEGYRNLTFDINGNRRTVKIEDKNATVTPLKKTSVDFADPDNESQIGSSIPGKVVSINVEEGQEIKAGDPIMVIEAMKMESNIVANHDGIINEILVKVNDMVKSGELIATLK